MRTVKHFISNSETLGNSTEVSPIWDPAAGCQQAQVCLATPSDVDEVVRVAKVAFGLWSQSSLTTRANVLFAFRELVAQNIQELAEAISIEHGKVVSDARGEVLRGLEVIEFATNIPHLLKGDYSDNVSTDVDTYSFREPLGVVAGVTPFNFPVMVPMWMYPIAIACGNTFILKPSERDPSPSLLVADLWKRAGLPSGVFNVLQGDKTAVDGLLEHPDVSVVSFVGSTPIARYVHEKASRTGKRVQALGGAKNHAVVMPDADMEFAANHLIAAAFGSAGERCMAISVAVAVGDCADVIVEKVRAKAEAIVVGPGHDVTSEMGPVVTNEARERILAAIESGVSQGSTVVADGRGLVVSGFEDGFFVGPTVLDRVTPEMDAYRDEIFGPVLVVVRVSSLEEAIELINNNPYGNGASIFTSRGEAARRFQRGVSVGMIGINVPIPVPVAHYSFGGRKDSIFGEHRVYGVEGISFYTQLKVVTSRWPHVDVRSEVGLQFPTSH